MKRDLKKMIEKVANTEDRQRKSSIQIMGVLGEKRGKRVRK